MTRREATRRLSLLGGLSVLVPTVTSILAPTPAAAATCLPIPKGGACLPSQCGQECGNGCGKATGSKCLNFSGTYKCGKGGVCP